MLRVGLTGGIGSGKSTVARRLVQRGAVLVDSDVLAREVVAAGTEGLAEIVDAFGPQVLDAAGALDRPALASVVFGDRAARERLNAIVHPRVRQRSDQLIGAAPDDAVVLQDIPLLVEGGMAPLFPLVVVVHADAQERVRRLVELRGMPEADARARIAAQAEDAQRRAVADVWLDNGGAPGDLVPVVDTLWSDRLLPFEQNLRLRRPAAPAPRPTTAADPEWGAAGNRLAARVAVAAGERGRGVEHVGPTAVPGLPAPDVIDLQLGVASAADLDAVAEALLGAGFPRLAGTAAGEPARRHRSADPGRAVHLQVREVGSPGWRAALLLRDWLRADPAARDDHRADAGDGEEAVRQWSEAALPQAEAWAASSAWVPSLH